MTHDSCAPLSVLVVDDYDDAAQSTSEFLLLAGHAPRIACNSPDALAAARVDPPDVVLLDIGMPGMDGWEVAARLRAQARGKQPLIVAVTGFGTRADRERSTRAGIDLHLIKPVDPEALLGFLFWVRKILPEHRLGTRSASVM